MNKKQREPRSAERLALSHKASRNYMVTQVYGLRSYLANPRHPMIRYAARSPCIDCSLVQNFSYLQTTLCKVAQA